jgi:subtilisin family serine protease
MMNMNIQPEQPLPEILQPPKQKSGCGYLILFALGAFWAIGMSLLFQFIAWTLEQGIFEGSLAIPDLRWVVNLALGTALLVPFILVLIFVKAKTSRALLRTWSWAAAFALLLFPSRFLRIEDFQGVMALQVGLMLVFLLLFLLFGRPKPSALQNISVGRGAMWVGLSLLLGMLPVFPWIMLGALGSLLDIVLALTNSLVFGICAGLLLSRSLFAPRFSTQNGGVRLGNILSTGLAAVVTLLIMVAGIAQNGNQWILCLSVPVIGWGAAAISVLELGEKRTVYWLPAAMWLGLAAFWPLNWIDPDELMLVVGMGSQEAIGVATRAAVWGLLISLAAIVLLLIFRRRSPQSASTRIFVLVLLLVAGAVAVYIFAGRPGLYGERLFVIFNDQADVSPALKIADMNQRRAYVYSTLTARAGQSQAELRGVLDRWKIDYQPYYLVNALEVNGGPLLKAWLESRPEVDRVLPNPILRPLPEPVSSGLGTAASPSAVNWNQTMIGADQVWKMGITGKGIVVGQSDSGVQGDHPEVVEAYRGRNEGDDYNWFDPWNHSQKPVDIGGHGTHTLGTILGKQVGIAPGAEWIGCVNLARNLGNPSFYLDCMQFMLAPFPQNGDPLKDGRPERGAQILNNSWGCPEVEGCDPGTFSPAVKALRDAGIFVVVSAGNSGYKGCGSVEAPPAIYSEVYSVGAVNQAGNRSDFSSLGPVTVDGSRRVKPDILAPGEGVLSSFPNSTYEENSGTSMAGPHLVGVVALMWSANPSLIGDIDRTIQILDQTARPYEGAYPACVKPGDRPDNAAGYGIVDAYAAVKLAMGK